MKKAKRILAYTLAITLSLYGFVCATPASAKSAGVSKKAYTISKSAGTYSGKVTVKVTAKKGYTVYYTLGKKLSAAKKISSKKTKTFTFKKTRTLKLYAVRSTKALTSKKLKKIKVRAMAKYRYIITSESNNSTDDSTSSTQTSSSQTGSSAASGNGSNTTSGTGSSATSGNASGNAAPAESSEQPKAPTQPGDSNTSTPTITQPSDSQYTGNDSTADYVEPTRITYTEDDTNVSSEGATEITLPAKATEKKTTYDTYEINKKNKLTITAPGTYVISSEDSETAAADGLIEVDYDEDKYADSTEGVHIILNGVNLTSSNNTAPTSDTGLITIKNSVPYAVITIADGSVNTLTDTGETGIDKDDSTSTTYTAGIVCRKTPLTINGSGTLNIYSTNGNGIKCTDVLKILDATISVSGSDADTATGHNGITGKTGLAVKDATLNIHSNADALKTTLDDDDVTEDSTLSELGNIDLDGGSYTLISENGDGVSAYRTLYLNPTSLSTTTKNAAVSTEDGSYKAIKAGVTIYAPSTCGTITADSTATYSASRASGDSNDALADDTIHCNGYIKLDGGVYTLAAGDDAIHSDAGLTINGGTITISECYEGLESGDITVIGGTIDITSRDDGMNAAGGNDSTSTTTTDSFRKGDASTSTQFQIIISGGSITIDADGDGIDSNGNIFFKGGTVIVNGPENGGNGALDYGDSADCVCEISGGTLIAAGASGMDAAPTSGSSQPVVNVRLSSTQSAGTYVVLKDSSGNTVLTAQPTKSFQSIILSCEDLTLGSTYTVYYGSNLQSLTQGDTFTFTAASVSTGSTSGSGTSSGGWTPGGTMGNRPGGR